MKTIVTYIAGTRRIILFAVSLLLLSPLFMACGEQVHAISPTTPTAGHTNVFINHSHTTTDSSLAGFTGTWYNHGGALKIAPDGTATFDARAYRWCGPGVPTPCDTMKNNLIIDGIHMNILFNHAQGSTIYGRIMSATTHDSGFLVTLTLNHNNTATLNEEKSSPSHLNEIVCNLQAQPGTCGA
ncbi:hypothetical protein ccbrp13_69770 [Ktedonobacteria bacterium brp13]|nr:hypothetical protein ccbrp13_69770 [Ktedonobacteria bacterium brp13]